MESAIGLHTVYGPCLAALPCPPPAHRRCCIQLLEGKAHGEKFVLPLLYPTGRQSAHQKRADIRAPHIEQVRQGLGMVAVAP
jgi:hypothetical protein